MGREPVLCTAQRLTACVSVLEILASRGHPQTRGRQDEIVPLVHRLVGVVEGWEFWIGGRIIGRGGVEDAVFLGEMARICADVRGLSAELPSAVLSRLAHELGDIFSSIECHIRDMEHVPDEAHAYRHLGKFMAGWRA